jgi:G:T-mismatch repair DNA endonuclease (very short patch repair protein)
MELVDGVSITDYCAKMPRHARRLALFVQVCEWHAHHKACTDIKASNARRRA